LVPRFMAWKLATGYVLTGEMWHGPERTRSGEEAVLTVGVSYHERMVVIRRIRRTPALSFGPAEWLPPDALDDTYFQLLPSGQTSVTPEEAAMLATVFAEDGELPARPAATGAWSAKDFRQRSKLPKWLSLKPSLHAIPLTPNDAQAHGDDPFHDRLAFGLEIVFSRGRPESLEQIVHEFKQLVVLALQRIDHQSDLVCRIDELPEGIQGLPGWRTDRPSLFCLAPVPRSRVPRRSGRSAL
jgi:hypothetical protein